MRYHLAIHLTSSERTNNPVQHREFENQNFDDIVTYMHNLADFYQKYAETGYLVLYNGFAEEFTLYF